MVEAIGSEAELNPDTPDNSKEERQNTGRYVVMIVVAFVCMLGLYHAFVQQNAVLAGLIVPAFIMFLYIGWILYTARKTRRKQMRAAEMAKDNPAAVV